MPTRPFRHGGPENFTVSFANQSKRKIRCSFSRSRSRASRISMLGCSISCMISECSSVHALTLWEGRGSHRSRSIHALRRLRACHTGVSLTFSARHARITPGADASGSCRKLLQRELRQVDNLAALQGRLRGPGCRRRSSWRTGSRSATVAVLGQGIEHLVHQVRVRAAMAAACRS